MKSQNQENVDHSRTTKSNYLTARKAIEAGQRQCLWDIAISPNSNEALALRAQRLLASPHIDQLEHIRIRTADLIARIAVRFGQNGDVQ